MSNPKGNEASLKKFKPKWQSGETRTIRVPISLTEQILDYAHKLDESPLQVNQPEIDPAIAIGANSMAVTLRQVINYLEDIAESGNFSKKLRARLRPEGIDPLESLIQVNKESYDYFNPDGVQSKLKH
jgi:hypothetical protein